MSRPTRADVAGRAYLDLQNLARRQGRTTQSLLTLYVLERFLARLEVSAYADRFVLKGGMLLAAWEARRATVDADFLARNLPVEQTAVLDRVVEIATTRPAEDDGVEFRTETATSSTIRDGDLYGGVRVAMDALLAGARVKLRLDISTGDPVVPPPDLITYPTLRGGDRDVRILGYPLSSFISDFAEQRSASYTAYLRRLGPDATRLPENFASVVQGVVDFADPVLLGALSHGETWRCSDRRWM